MIAPINPLEPQLPHRLLPMSDTGRIFQLNISPGGVPKTPVHTAEVTWLGLAGDAQRDTRHHGGPERALCLYSLEYILALQAEGHPIFPGSIGENITLTGLAWANLTPGVALQLGADVTIVITSYVTPCRNIRESFQSGHYQRVAAQVHPGWARLYARVLRPGVLRPGDPVSVVAGRISLAHDVRDLF